MYELIPGKYVSQSKYGYRVFFLEGIDNHNMIKFFFAFSVARDINFTVRPQNFEFYVDSVMFWFFSMMQ